MAFSILRQCHQCVQVSNPPVEVIHGVYVVSRVNTSQWVCRQHEMTHQSETSMVPTQRPPVQSCLAT